ncbi:MAG TPA: hypothetical protein DCR44_00760 [Acholeplasmatales bacterium]|nr:MAG: hypothetical protein A2Y16_06915 [Tenericutes bacterium GWF2_57_13]HAQ55930.1 hypothetical protein [Acholeplasmatales bacterium]
MKRPLKIFLIVGGVFLFLILTGMILFSSMGKGLENLLTLEIEDVDLTTLPDGTYEGSYTQLPVIATVRVTVVDHVITDIVIVEHFNGQGASGEAVVDSVIAANSLEVDAIAGATYSSKVILLAIKDALVEQESID